MVAKVAVVVSGGCVVQILTDNLDLDAEFRLIDEDNIECGDEAPLFSDGSSHESLMFDVAF
jgi:hypothetical protein